MKNRRSFLRQIETKAVDTFAPPLLSKTEAQAINKTEMFE